MTPEEQRAALATALADAGSLPAEWAPAFNSVPRHAFLPDTIWTDEADEDPECSRSEEPERWMRLAYSDLPIITQWDDGTENAEHTAPTSSASMPTIVAEMLSDLGAEPGHRTLEIGTGTGYNAALLAHRLGAAMVSTVEVDARVAAQARTALRGAGYAPEVVCGDGSLGWGVGAPYDRIISTVSLRDIPAAWIAQTRPGGVIVSPVSPLFGGGAIVRLTVDGEGAASGRFTRSSAFMMMRQQRYEGEPVEDYLSGEWPGDSEQSWTKLDPEAAIGDDWPAQFACALALPDVYYRRNGFGEGWTWWLFDTAVTSWATVDSVPGESRFEVRQSGPRRLWDEVETAWRWWDDQGRPDFDRFGLTVGPGGHTAWLDSPENPVPLRS
ncbi:protein-L-isoaspartate(D-aspartate) O-methyltransferase [Kitasatospora sp. NPDC056783]|uniref:protein-L-isoaspartate(D-aspartate) O-methyltransferase n=1 Tax=Kitasatospora sp. NPDC056783 TaxID=3345943 RepID=UPI0036C02042